MQSTASDTGVLGLIHTPGPPSVSLAPLPEDTAPSPQQPTSTPTIDSLIPADPTHTSLAHTPSNPTTAQQLIPPSDPSFDHTGPSDIHHTPPALVRPVLSIEPPFSPSIPPLPSQSHSTTSLNSHSMTTRTKDRTLKKRQFSDFIALHFTAEVEPTSFTQAVKSSHWRSAMAAEIDALAANRTWSLVPAPPNRPVIGSKWVYKIKRNSDGSIERYKARLVAKGYNQQQGIDFEETYSPVIRTTTVRVVLSLAVSSRWPIKQLDVSNAFLNGDLTETVYMVQPQGFIDQLYPNHVCLLHKSLYGLKQAPRAWFAKLNQTLLQLGFKASSYDPSLFLSHKQGTITLILVYVDDILVTGNDSVQIQNYIAQLSAQFKIRDLGDLHFFLGIEAKFTTQGLFLSQKKYLSDLLTRTNMHKSKPCSSPMASGTSLTQHGSSLCQDPFLYRSVVGALQYATLTRPELAFSVNKASQFMHTPTEDHWSAVKRILRYVAGTLDYGLHISHDSDNLIHAYSDADWAGNIDDRRSTSGFCVFLGSNLVSWCAKKQSTVSRSSTEAEYRSLALTCTEIMWLQYLLQEIQVPSSTPTLWCDNIGATFLAANPMFHARTKHIEIDFHFVRERVANNQLRIRFLCSADQLADAMTKPLPLPRFQFLRTKLKVTSCPFA